jgi:FMN phosphatase YigB (HAD superfamily)
MIYAKGMKEDVRKIIDARHISFDLWGTIFEPNPNYAKARNLFLADMFAAEEDHVAYIYNVLKKELDLEAEGTGIIPQWQEIYRKLAVALQDEDADIGQMKRGFEQLAVLFPPMLIPALVRNLNALVINGKTISLGSNTNFITGSAIRSMLKDYGIPFLFMIFSDEVLWAKPSGNFFNRVKENIYKYPYNYNPIDIVHIGNNYACDVEGPINSGIGGVLIKNPLHLNRLLEEVLNA